jgi:hypothetical protein
LLFFCLVDLLEWIQDFLRGIDEGAHTKYPSPLFFFFSFQLIQ